MFIVACVLNLVVNLLPVSRGNDGRQLLALLSTRRPPFAELAQLVTTNRAALLVMRRENVAAEQFARKALQDYPLDTHLLVALSAALLNQRRYLEGRQLLLTIPAQQPESALAAVLYNNLAWADLNLADPALVAEARAMSAAAYRLIPWEIHASSTFGCVEALHGDAAAALPILERTVDKLTLNTERASTKAALAMAYARLHRQQESLAALTDAEALDASCVLLQIVREHLAGTMPSSALAVSEPVSGVALEAS
jgi:hypothetical protein